MITESKLRSFLGIPATAWVTAFSYEVGKYVTQAGVTYECIFKHTSGTFATDLGNGYWTADTNIDNCIADAIGEANRTANRTFEYGIHTVYLDGTGTDYIYLNQAPIYSVTALQYWDGENYVDILDAGDTLAGSLIYPGGFKLVIKGYTFYRGSVLVTFASGYKYADRWLDNHAYILTNLVMYNGNLYECSTAHTSGTTFDATKWTLLTAETPPADLEKAVKYNAALIYYESPAGKNYFAKTSENLGGASSKGAGFDFKGMREYYTATYESYRVINI